MTPLVALVSVLAVYRLTLLVVADELTRPARTRALSALTGEEHPDLTAPSTIRERLAYLLTCPWCASFWVAIPVVVSALAWGDESWWLAGAGVLAASALTGLLASYASP